MRTAVWDVRRNSVPDKGSPNREQPVTKAFKVSSMHRNVPPSPLQTPRPPPQKKKKKKSELELKVRDGEYTERQGDRYGGWVSTKKRKAAVVILKIIL